jgi:hypothetical protein
LNAWILKWCLFLYSSLPFLPNSLRKASGIGSDILLIIKKRRIIMATQLVEASILKKITLNHLSKERFDVKKSAHFYS